MAGSGGRECENTSVRETGKPRSLHSTTEPHCRPVLAGESRDDSTPDAYTAQGAGKGRQSVFNTLTAACPPPIPAWARSKGEQGNSSGDGGGGRGDGGGGNRGDWDGGHGGGGSSGGGGGGSGGGGSGVDSGQFRVLEEKLAACLADRESDRLKFETLAGQLKTSFDLIGMQQAEIVTLQTSMAGFTSLLQEQQNDFAIAAQQEAEQIESLRMEQKNETAALQQSQAEVDQLKEVV